jgi:hypothetical protein
MTPTKNSSAVSSGFWLQEGGDVRFIIPSPSGECITKFQREDHICRRVGLGKGNVHYDKLAGG